MWNEVAMARLRYYPGMFLEGLRKITQILVQDCLVSGLRYEPGTSWT
jgi:hypothetical protein